MDVPCTGTIIAFDLTDLVGRLELDDGSILRVGGTALRGLVPSVGTRVVVEQVAPHPLGGYRAQRIALADTDASSEAEAHAFQSALAKAREEDAKRIEEAKAKLAHFVPSPPTERETQELVNMRERALAEDREQQAREEQEDRWRSTAHMARTTQPPAQAWSTILRETNVGASEVEAALAVSRPAAAIVPASSRSSRGVASRLGGTPDAPVDFRWPLVGDRPLAFLGQFQLSEVPEAVRADLFLPDDGLLAFFYDAGEQPWGFDPADADGARVYLFQAPDDLVRAQTPEQLAPEHIYAELPVALLEDLTLPVPGSPAFESLGFDDATTEAFLDGLGACAGAYDRPRHWLGGHADPIQRAMERECALVTGGVYMGGGTIDRSDPIVAECLAQAPKWRLLLQLDSDDDLGTMWGDMGRLYFWVHEEQLRQLSFERAWCVLQCT